MYKNNLLITACIWLCSTWLNAQNSADSIAKTISLDEVVVSASKETSHIKELPASVSVLPAMMLEQENINSLKNISALVPNLYMPDYGSKLNSPIYIRGIGSRVNSPSVGLYVDGIPYFEAMAFDFDFFDIENVEVLRGPQGTLYGRNTMGGIINVNTMSPLNHQGTTVRLSGGNYGYAKASLTNYSKIGERIGIASGINYYHRGGYFENQYTGKNIDKQDDISARLRFMYKHNDRTRSELHANYEHSSQNGYPYGIYDKTTGEVDSVNYNDESGYDRDLLSAGYRFEHDTHWGSIRATTGYQYFKDKQSVDQDFTPKPVYFVVQDQAQNMLSQEVIARSNLNGNYRWVTGAFGFYQHIDKTVDVHTKISNSHALKTYDQPIYGLAAYHQSTYNNLFVNGLSATLGLRLDYENSKQGYVYDVITPAATTPMDNTDTRLDFLEFLPKFALRYEYAGQAVYASVAKGYKTGGFNTSFDTEDEQTFDPETSWNYELGVKLKLPANTSLEASVFYIDWNNQQITQSLASKVGSMITNAGRSESTGVEISLNTKPFKNFSFYVNYGYTHAVFKDYMYTKYNTQTKTVDSTDYSGNYVPQVPQQTLTLGPSYRLPIEKQWMDDITFHAQYTGIGKINWYDNNNVSQDYYGLLNGSVCFRKGIFDVNLWARNILNEKYLTYYFESGSAFAQTGKPLTFGVDIKIEF